MGIKLAVDTYTKNIVKIKVAGDNEYYVLDLVTGIGKALYKIDCIPLFIQVGDRLGLVNADPFVTFEVIDVRYSSVFGEYIVTLCKDGVHEVTYTLATLSKYLYKYY